MTKEELEQVESSQRQHHEVLRQQEVMGTAVESAEYNLFATLKPTLQRDGNQWCVLYGEDLQTGIAGFGKSPYLAILDWNKQWWKELEK